MDSSTLTHLLTLTPVVEDTRGKMGSQINQFHPSVTSELILFYLLKLWIWFRQVTFVTNKE